MKTLLFVFSTYKGIVFFFPRKNLPLTHSFNFWEFCFFFLPIFERKKKVFFILGKFCKPLTRQKSGCPQEKVKKGKKKAKKNSFSNFGGVFFFQKNLKTFCFIFYPGKVYTALTHSFSEGGKKKKKKTHSLDVCQKVVQNELLRRNKNISYLFHIVKQFFSHYEVSRKDFFFNPEYLQFSMLILLFVFSTLWSI